MRNAAPWLAALLLAACAAAPDTRGPALPVEKLEPAPAAALAGRSVADVLATMRADRFACALEYRPGAAQAGHAAGVRDSAGEVILSCSRWDPSPERACIEERVVFQIDWPDPAGDPLAQLDAARILAQAFRCAPNWNRPAAR